MTSQMMICLIIFVATIISYAINRIPMWLTALLSLCALFLTGCIDASSALAGFANVNTILIATMYVVAAGFRRTSMMGSMVRGIVRATKASFNTAYFGYILLALLLTNFISTPMVVYAIVCPLLCGFLDQTGRSRSKYVFPLMVVCISCYGILPLSTAIQQAGQYTGFLETYGFPDVTVSPVDFLKAGWPLLIIVPVWAVYLAPRFTPEKPSVQIGAMKNREQMPQTELSTAVNRIGIALFFATIICLVFSSAIGLPAWIIALLGSLLMCLFGVVDSGTVLQDIHWDVLMLYAGSLALGNAMSSTGTGELIGRTLAAAVGGTRNSYLLGAVFFLITFLFTQVMMNRPAMAVFTPICLLTCTALGADPKGLVILVNAGCTTSFLTPMATPAVSMCMADGGYTLKDMLKSSWLITLILCAVYVFYVMTIFPCF